MNEEKHQHTDAAIQKKTKIGLENMMSGSRRQVWEQQIINGIAAQNGGQ